VVHVVIFMQDLIRRPSFRTLTNAPMKRLKPMHTIYEKCPATRACLGGSWWLSQLGIAGASWGNIGKWLGLKVGVLFYSTWQFS
jgi:hypothetical protein